MASITTWRRIEPRTRTDTLTALAARVADPLWLLARQWQSGELTGSDSGTPVQVRLMTESSVATRWLPGAATATAAGPGRPLDPGQPVEPLVEALAAPIGLVERATGGRRLVGLLRSYLPAAEAARYAAAFGEEYRLPGLDPDENDRCDDAGRRWAALLAGRSIDGAAVRAELGPSGAVHLPARPAIDPVHSAGALGALSAFAAWWDARHPVTSGAWQPTNLAAPHRLGASSSAGPIALVAPEHRGGALEWHTYDVAPGGALAAGDQPSAPVTSQPVPTRVSFVGAPAARWWELEDAAVDLGRIEAAPDDLGRLVLAEFALVYGNDFFAVPLTVPVGSITRVHRLEVTTTFSETVTVPAAAAHDGTQTAARRWRMWQCDGAPGGTAEAGLVVPPGVVGALDGGIAEDVLLTRDEQADVAWAIERRVLGPVGTPVERREVEAARRERDQPQPEVTAEPYYWLATPLPDAWLPLVPRPDGTLVATGGGGAQSRLVGDAGAGPFTLPAIELPSVGRRVRLLPRRARGTDGSVRTWWTWRVGAGRGESSSGLTFDDLAYRPPPRP